MKKILFIVIPALVLMFQASIAQTTQLHFKVTNASSASACDGAMEVQCIGSTLTPVTFQWYDTTGTLIGTGNSVTGLCPSNNYGYSLYVNDETCPGQVLFALVRVASVAGPSFEINTSLLYMSTTLYNYFHIDSARGGVSPYRYELYNDWDNSPGTSIDQRIYADSNLTSISNVAFDSLYDPYFSSSEFYTLYVTDVGANVIGYYFTNRYDTSITCNQGPDPLWADAQGYAVTDSALCDGWGYINAAGGTPPYTYLFPTGGTNSSESGLCPGSYIVSVTDAIGTVYNTTFVVGYPGTIYISDPGAMSYIDTLYTNAAQQCGLDFSVPLDSFYVDTSFVVNNWAYQVNWVLIQNSNSFLFSEIYSLDSTGNYMFGLSVYCNSRSFGSFSLLAGIHVDGPLALGIKDSKADELLEVYPNPSTGIYQLSADKKIKNYKVSDQLGKVIIDRKLNSMQDIISLNDLSKGAYFLEVNFENGTVSRRKLLKN